MKILLDARAYAEAVEPAAYAADIAMHTLLTGVYDRDGAVAMASVAEGFLRGVQTAIAARIGREAAYATLKRHADNAAHELALCAEQRGG